MNSESTDETNYGSESSGTVTSKPPTYQQSQKALRKKNNSKTSSATNLARSVNNSDSGTERRLSLTTYATITAQPVDNRNSNACASSSNVLRKETKSTSHIIVTPIYKTIFDPGHYYIYFHIYSCT